MKVKVSSPAVVESVTTWREDPEGTPEAREFVTSTAVESAIDTFEDVTSEESVPVPSPGSYLLAVTLPLVRFPAEFTRTLYFPLDIVTVVIVGADVVLPVPLVPQVKILT